MLILQASARMFSSVFLSSLDVVDRVLLSNLEWMTHLRMPYQLQQLFSVK